VVELKPTFQSRAPPFALHPQAYVIASGQMFRPAEAGKSPLATLHSGNSKWVKSMTGDFAAVGGGATTKGYFMDGGSLIANPYG
jgi:hypothetical protein